MVLTRGLITWLCGVLTVIIYVEESNGTKVNILQLLYSLVYSTHSCIICTPKVTIIQDYRYIYFEIWSLLLPHSELKFMLKQDYHFGISNFLAGMLL